LIIKDFLSTDTRVISLRYLLKSKGSFVIRFPGYDRNPLKVRIFYIHKIAVAVQNL
jgi:hypothetical protein